MTIAMKFPSIKKQKKQERKRPMFYKGFIGFSFNKETKSQEERSASDECFSQFLNNIAAIAGGGVYFGIQSRLSRPLRDLGFVANQAQIGGGIYWSDGRPTGLQTSQAGACLQCSFKDNFARDYGANVSTDCSHIQPQADSDGKVLFRGEILVSPAVEIAMHDHFNQRVTPTPTHACNANTIHAHLTS